MCELFTVYCGNKNPQYTVNIPYGAVTICN